VPLEATLLSDHIFLGAWSQRFVRMVCLILGWGAPPSPTERLHWPTKRWVVAVEGRMSTPSRAFQGCILLYQVRYTFALATLELSETLPSRER
jgi:hypothetical protein